MKVYIIGASLSGLTLAKALVNRKIYVELISKKKKLSLSQNRTLGISRNNIEYFNNQIINLDKLVWKLKKIEIFSENLNKEKLLKFENNEEYLFSILKNHKLYKILEKSLLKNKYFKKTSSRKNLNKSKNDNLIINTDFFDIINKKFFSKKIIKKYHSRAFTTIIKHKKIINDTAIQIFTKKGPLAFLPISDCETSIVYSVNSFKENKKDFIEGLIHHYNFKYRIINIKKINSFELNSLNLRSYFYKNILAFGDLLHKIHPLAGQGFNMTLRDIKCLLDIIQNKINLGMPLDSSVNYEFEKKLRHKNFIFSNGIDYIYELFNYERKTNNNLLSKAIQKIGKYPSVNKIFTEIANKGI